MKVLKVFSYPDEAFLAKAHLEGSGIEAHVDDHHMVTMNPLYSNAVGGVRLRVKEEDFERAREVLGLPPAEKGDLQCPSCGSDNVEMRKISLLFAISTMAGVPLPFASSKVDCKNCGRTFEYKPGRAAK